MMVLEERGLGFCRARMEEADNSKLMWLNNSYYLTGSIWYLGGNIFMLRYSNLDYEALVLYNNIIILIYKLEWKIPKTSRLNRLPTFGI
jgi:hypothetical protein